LLNALYVLCYKDLEPAFISRVFEIRILSLAGFAPVLDRCSVCGGPLQADGGAGFALYGDGMVCAGAECKKASGRLASVSRGTLKAINFVACCEAGDIFRFHVSGAVLSELANIIPAYLRFQFGKEYNMTEEAERYRAFEREINKISKGIEKGRV
jgi:DNA repair protein RecO (recombination protein O)